MTDRSKRIAELNDKFRQTGEGGKVVLTVGVRSLPRNLVEGLIAEVQHFDKFTQENDPYGERDFGIVKMHGYGTFYWKIDYYDRNLEYGSEDPTNPEITARVLTIMCNHEY